MSASRCFHCHEPLAGSTLRAQLGAVSEPVCCVGCQAVAEFVAGNGLQDFYQRRSVASPRPSMSDRWSVYADPQLAAEFTTSHGASVSVALLIEGLRCSACAWLIERSIGSLPDVSAVSVNAATGHAHIQWRAGVQLLEQVMRGIALLGYVPHLLTADAQAQVQRQERRRALKQLAVATFGMMQVMMFAIADYAAQLGGETLDPLLAQYFRIVSLWVSVAVLAYAGRPFLLNASRQLRARTLGMDVPVGSALLLGFLASAWHTLRGSGAVYFDSITMFVFFLTLSRGAALWVRHQTLSAGLALAQHLPAVARRWRDARIETVPLRQLQSDDEVLVCSGGIVPADGVICDGATLLDEAWLTGESLPVARSVGETVSCGSINTGAPIRVRITSPAQSSQLAGVAALLSRAQAQKPAALRLADRQAAAFTRCVLIAGVVVSGTWLMLDPQRALSATLAVLIVACPCAFSIAMPAALAAATAALARRGVLVTRVDALETLAGADHCIFDKTGTLTRGAIAFERCETFGPASQRQCLALAAALERSSDHPVAAAFREHDVGLNVSEVRTFVGYGVEGSIGGERHRIGTLAFVAELCGPTHCATQLDMSNDARIHIAIGSRTGLLAVFSLSDVLREDSANAVSELQHAGLSTEMLSGDGTSAVHAMARRCGIETFTARCTPAAKLARIRALQQRGKCVIMVGDGINDAPVLAAADVSIAMGRGAALAQAAADVILINERPAQLAPLVMLARQTVRVARQNLFWSAGYNLSAVPLAAFGLIPPWLAALGMAASSILVLLNALRVCRTPTASSARPAALHFQSASL